MTKERLRLFALPPLSDTEKESRQAAFDKKKLSILTALNESNSVTLDNNGSAELARHYRIRETDYYLYVDLNLSGVNENGIRMYQGRSINRPLARVTFDPKEIYSQQNTSFQAFCDKVNELCPDLIPVIAFDKL